MPRVTVAILAYDRPEFLGTAIESVLAQTYTDFKLIIYDNCSTKDLKAVVDRYDDPRIIYHRNEKNIGMFGNAAQAVDLCDTELLAILHDDDRYFPWAIERLVEAMDAHPEVGFASSKSFITMGRDDPNRYREQRGGTLYTDMMLAEVTAGTGRLPLFSGMMARPTDLRSKGMNFRPDAGPAGDLLFCLECSSHGVATFGLDAPLIEYRHHPGQASSTETADAWLHTFKRCCDCAASLRLSRSAVDAIRERSRTACASLYARALADGGRLAADELDARRDSIERAIDTKISQKEFDKCVCIGVLSSIVDAIVSGEASVSEYRSRLAALKKIGISVPLGRRIEWSFKCLRYTVVHRWLGRRP